MHLTKLHINHTMNRGVPISHTQRYKNTISYHQESLRIHRAAIKLGLKTTPFQPNCGRRCFTALSHMHAQAIHRSRYYRSRNTHSTPPNSSTSTNSRTAEKETTAILEKRISHPQTNCITSITDITFSFFHTLFKCMIVFVLCLLHNTNDTTCTFYPSSKHELVFRNHDPKRACQRQKYTSCSNKNEPCHNSYRYEQEKKHDHFNHHECTELIYRYNQDKNYEILNHLECTQPIFDSFATNTSPTDALITSTFSHTKHTSVITSTPTANSFLPHTPIANTYYEIFNHLECTQPIFDSFAPNTSSTDAPITNTFSYTKHTCVITSTPTANSF